VRQPDPDHARAVTSAAKWRYLLDPTDYSVTVQHRSGIRTWQVHARHRLGLPCAPPCGDAATGHQWIPAFVSIDGWIGPYPADICVGQHGSEPQPARFTTAVARHICADTFARRREGRTDRPVLRPTLDGGQFEIVAAQSGRSHIQPVTVDRDGQHLIGAQQWRWRYQPTPAHPPRNTGGWAAAGVRYEDRIYEAHPPRRATQRLVVPRVHLRCRGPGRRRLSPRWCAQPGTDGGEFYRVTADGIELVHRPATSAETIGVEEPDDGLYALGCESWPWESATGPGRDEDYI